MEITPTRTNLGGGVHFTSIIDPKFTRNRISLRAILPLSEDTAATNAIVPLLLRKGCKSYPDFTALNAKLEELYGATLSTHIGRLNAHQVLTLSINALDNRFALEGEDIIAECTQLLTELFLQPALDENGCFPAADVALEQQAIVDSIQAEINDKRSYSITECVRRMSKGDPLAIHRYGSVASAQAVTPERATSAWKNIVSTAEIEVFFTGSGNPSSSKSALTEAFSQITREPVSTSMVPIRDHAQQVRQERQVMDITQGNLAMGFRVAGLETKKEKDAARVFSAIYGGSPFSKLFQHVRERLSLCYYCSSSIDVINNLMLVSSGIEFSKKEKAEAEILHQLEQMQEGHFTEEDVEQSKLLIYNSLQRIGDTPISLENWHLQRALLGEDYSPTQDMEDIATVTHKDIEKIANAITLDTVFFLTADTKEDAQ